MSIRFISITFFIMVGITPPTYGMYCKKIAAGAATAAAFTYWKLNQKKKKHFLYDVSSNTIQDIPTTREMFLEGGSSTFKYVDSYHRSCYPEKYLTSEECAFEIMIDDILKDKYREIPFGYILDNEQREGLKKSVLFFAEQEIKYSKTHYVFYHGTFGATSQIFRTMMANKFDTEPAALPFFLLRDKGITKELENMEDSTTFMQNLAGQRQTVGGMTLYAGIDSHPTARKTFLAANVPAMGNTGAYPGGGENSLVFISTIPSGMNTWTAPVVGLVPKMVDPFFFAVVRLIDASIRTLTGQRITVLSAMPYTNDWYMKQAAHSYGKTTSRNLIPYQPELASLARDSGGMIQIMVPKEKMQGIYECEPFGMKSGTFSLEERLEWMQQHPKQNEDFSQSIDMQVRIPLYPSLFENADSGIKMNMIVFAEPKKFEKLITHMSYVIDELHTKRDSIENC